MGRNGGVDKLGVEAGSDVLAHGDGPFEVESRAGDAGNSLKILPIAFKVVDREGVRLDDPIQVGRQAVDCENVLEGGRVGKLDFGENFEPDFGLAHLKMWAG